jgi:excisionase family DNA binding protein
VNCLERRRAMPEKSANGHDELLTPDEVAAMLKMTPARVLDWGRQGKLPRIKLGKFVRFHRADVERLIEQRTARR